MDVVNRNVYVLFLGSSCDYVLVGGFWSKRVVLGFWCEVVRFF